MSLLVVAAAVLGYLIIVVFALGLLRVAKRADEAAEREHRALVRAKKARAPLTVVSDADAERDIVASRRAG